MAEECTEAASSSPPPNWWDLHHATSSLSSWTNPNLAWHQQNPNSNSEEDVSISPSFTTASNHSGLTVESSRRLHAEPPHASSQHDHFMGEAAPDNHMWSQVLLGVGSNGELHNNGQDVGENLLDSTAMFEPACDYLKQLENWELRNSPSFTHMEKHYLTGYSESLMDSERLTKLSNLVSNWSIAPPNPELNRHFEPQPSMDHNHYSTNSYRTNLSSCYGIDHLKMEDDRREMEGTPPGALLRRTQFNSNGMGHQVGDGNHGAQNNPPRNLADVISFTSRSGKPLIDQIHAQRPSSKAQNLSDTSKKQALLTSSPTRMNGGRRYGSNEGKKKRISEDDSETVLKKPKQEVSSTVSSTTKVPKVKLADRITALQQIVSPFGKTDTASVLYEAIGYIKFLQEQVQLLSNPYMKTNSQKDPWGGMDRKEKGYARHDLRSRGLCLVPISCTPQVYRENTGSDYWTPAYRGCLYR